MTFAQSRGLRKQRFSKMPVASSNTPMNWHPVFRVVRRRITLMSSRLAPPPPLSSLRGTVQQHNAYILLHTRPNQPPPTFPPRGPESQVHRRLQLAALKWGGVVNWVWYSPATSPCSSPSPTCCTTGVEIKTTAAASSISKSTTAQDSTAHKVEIETTAPAPSIPTSESTTLQDSTALNQVEPPNEEGDDVENYSATVFSKNGRLEIPQITLSNVEQVEETIRQFAVENDYHSSSSESAADSDDEPDEVHMLICTHMARDCRCGVRGGTFCRTVREEVAQRGFFLGDGEKKIRLRLGEVGHVGGHQYAPNVLIYPFGDWYGVLSPEQVSSVLDELSNAVESCGVRPLGKMERPLLTSVKDHWRGRMGMSKEEQASLAQSLSSGQRREDVDVEAND